MLIGLPVLLASRHGTLALARLWARSSIWLLDKICHVRVEFRGLENIPKGAYIIAAKHQSVWETFALTLHAPDFSFVLKRELTWIPFFGWYLYRGEQIAIDRASGRAALNQVVRRARKTFAEGRQLFIFPEGTRRPVGAPPEYKFGVSFLYSETNVPCLPVALNSGLFWPRRTFVRRPGKIVVRYLPPIAPGLPRPEFLARLQSDIETASNALLTEALAADPGLRKHLPAPEPTAPPASPEPTAAHPPA
jgi:1-acyl-sn-glycerol-3-phosphate acyltransferase